MTSATCADPAATASAAAFSASIPACVEPEVSAPPACEVQPSAAARIAWLGPSAKGGRAVPQKSASTWFGVDARRRERGRAGFPREREGVLVGWAHGHLASTTTASPRRRDVGGRQAPARCRGTDAEQSDRHQSLPSVGSQSVAPPTTGPRGDRRDPEPRVTSGTLPRSGGVAEWFRQGPAKPRTRVRFPSPPRVRTGRRGWSAAGRRQRRALAVVARGFGFDGRTERVGRDELVASARRAASARRTRARPGRARRGAAAASSASSASATTLSARLFGDFAGPLAHAFDRLFGDLQDVAGGLADGGRKGLVDHGWPFDRASARQSSRCVKRLKPRVCRSPRGARDSTPARRPAGAAGCARGRRSERGSAGRGRPCGARTRTAGG